MSSELCEGCELAQKCEAVRNATTIVRIGGQRNWPLQLRTKAFDAVAGLYPDCPRREMVRRLGQIMPLPKS